MRFFWPPRSDDNQKLAKKITRTKQKPHTNQINSIFSHIWSKSTSVTSSFCVPIRCDDSWFSLELIHLLISLFFSLSLILSIFVITLFVSPEFAWVTLATNDSYALGALVVAYSLKKVNTVHQLAVLVTPGVTPSMKEKLRTIFNIVEEVNVLDSKDAANLALLSRPELGITFTKLHCWRLTQFDKCVFLDADTFVSIKVCCRRVHYSSPIMRTSIIFNARPCS